MLSNYSLLIPAKPSGTTSNTISTYVVQYLIDFEMVPKLILDLIVRKGEGEASEAWKCGVIAVHMHDAR